MNVDDQMGSCRDKGRIWGRVGALCLSWWQRDPVGTAWSKQVAPQPGQAQGLLIHSTPPLVPTGPWAASISMDRIPRFGRQHSVGLDLAGGEERSSSFEPCLSEHTYEEVNQGFAGKGIFVTLVSFVSLVSLVSLASDVSVQTGTLQYMRMQQGIASARIRR